MVAAPDPNASPLICNKRGPQAQLWVDPHSANVSPVVDADDHRLEPAWNVHDFKHAVARPDESLRPTGKIVPGPRDCTAVVNRFGIGPLRVLRIDSRIGFALLQEAVPHAA